MISAIKNLYGKVKVFLVMRALDKDLNKEMQSNADANTNTEQVDEETSRKYNNGITAAVEKFQDLVNSVGQEAAQGTDVVSLATQESNKTLELQKEILIYKDKDINTEEDKTKMIDKRISIMYDLQNIKEKRNLYRQIRKARITKDVTAYNTLKAEFSKKYGK